MFFRLLPAALAICACASASLVRIEVQERGDVLDGKPFGSAGPYERIVGKAYFAVDPKLPANRIITDIDFAPRNEAGRVEFSADLHVLKPRDPKAGNGSILFEVSNRGRKGMLGLFDFAETSTDPQTGAQFGDRFLLDQGFTLVWLGWQPDVPRQPGLMRLYAPVATDRGQPITGLVRSEFVPDRRVDSFSLGDRTMEVIYPVLDPNDDGAALTVRDRVDGQRRRIPRSQWRFEERTRVLLTGGFEAGKIYEVVYRAKDPVVVGLGPAAIRDLMSFLKYGGTSEQGHVLFADQRRYLKRAIGFGVSQSGRFLRTFLYYGFNQDEQGRKVFDGVISHVAGGGRGSFNLRFAQPSRDAHPFMNMLYPTDIFPFADVRETDDNTGLGEGLLDRTEKAGVTPKIFYTNSSYEYYGRAASLIHTRINGKEDAPLARDTHIYLFAGGQHGPAAFPPRRSATRNLPNPNDFRWSMRALLVGMQSWIDSGKEPPPSQYPKIEAGQLVAIHALRFPKIPGLALPVRIHHAYRVDYGPRFRTDGIISIEPPKVGAAFPVLVPQVDADGNETSGILMPEVRVPLGTYTGWNLRDPSIGASEELFSMAGSWIPFARTRAEREKRGDPRPSIGERYQGRDDYLQRVSAAARQLASRGYLLEQDVPKLVERAATQWDYVLNNPER
jgi:hypothetical protein